VKKLKNDSFTRDIPIIAVTADTSHESVQKMQELGICDYLTKPLDFSELFMGIRKYL
jgi:DNA-binding response OmpR family regulator